MTEHDGKGLFFRRKAAGQAFLNRLAILKGSPTRQLWNGFIIDRQELMQRIAATRELQAKQPDKMEYSRPGPVRLRWCGVGFESTQG